MDNGKFPRQVRFPGVAVLALALTAGLPDSARAEYPERPITVVVPFAVGGATDILGRLMAASLSTRLGQPVVVENKPGSASVLGTGNVVRAKPDGYTLLFSTTAATNAPAMFKTLPYDPLKDIKPIAVFAEAPYVVAVNADKVKSATLKEFLELIRKNPGKLNASSGGSGTTLSVDLLLLKYDLSAQIVPYPSAGEAVTALAGGETDFMIVDAAPLGPYLASGKIRALAVSSNRRLPVLPDVPTAAEEGVAGYTDTGTAGMYIRADTPPEIVRKLNLEINAITDTPDMVDRLRKLGWSPLHETVDEAGVRYRDGIAQWKDIVARAHIPQVE